MPATQSEATAADEPGHFSVAAAATLYTAAASIVQARLVFGSDEDSSTGRVTGDLSAGGMPA